MTTFRNFIIFFLSFIFLFATYKKSNDCSKIKNGHFYYYSKISRDKVDLNRFDSIQIEKNMETGDILNSKIVWKNDCSFEMFINSLSKNKLEKIDSLIATIPLLVEIKFIGNEFYISDSKIEILNKTIESRDTIYFAN